MVRQEVAVDVSFRSGEDLLSSYWGYLSGGGLIIPDPGIEEGEPLLMHVTLAGSANVHPVAATVVKREEGSNRSIVAFAAGQVHDLLLSEAIADSEDVAPRRYARFRLECPVVALSCAVPRGLATSDQCKVMLVNLSQEGCCVELPKSSGMMLAKGERVEISHGGVQVVGTVVWSRNRERGLSMTNKEAVPLLQSLLPEMC